MVNILVTGAMGFIGSNFLLYWMDKHPEDAIINMDQLTYAADKRNVESIHEHPKYRFIRADISHYADVERILQMGDVDWIVHFAAESHVDNSIVSPERFVSANIIGTHNLLRAAKNWGVKKFVHISTDEVYGSLGSEGYFTEHTPISPNSPYSASKAASDLLVRAYCQTYGFPAVITRCSNNYGPRQFLEKLIPTIIYRAINNQSIPIYGDGRYVRDWLYVEDHCRAIELVLLSGKAGEVYNIGGGNEMTNLEITTRILCELGKRTDLIEFVKDRPGHDRRYAIDSSKIRQELGWVPAHTFDQGLRKTLTWYMENTYWADGKGRGER